MHGFGKLDYEDGVVYEGEFRNGSREGKGKLVYGKGE